MKNAKLLTIAMVIAALLAGCGGGGGTTTSNATLTPDQSTASHNSASASNVLGTLGQSFVFAADPAAHQNGRPIVTASVNGNIKTIVVDYGPSPGYTTPNGNSLTGSLTITLDTSLNTATIAFNNFAINGTPVTGTVAFSETQNAGQTTFVITPNITYGAQGTLTGTVTEVIDPSSGQFQIPSANLTWTTTQAAYNLILANLATDPVTNRFNAGTITINYTPSGGSQTSILITFNTSTPVTGYATASVNGGPTLPYKFY